MFELFDSSDLIGYDQQFLVKLNDICNALIESSSIIKPNYRLIENKAGGRVFIPAAPYFVYGNKVTNLNIDGVFIDVDNIIFVYGRDMFDETNDQQFNINEKLPYPNTPILVEIINKDTSVERYSMTLGCDQYGSIWNNFTDCTLFRLKYGDDRYYEDYRQSSDKKMIRWKYWQ